ncbi:MAG: hypothetical protein AABX30_01655 [Nanoarchaeota archaeon]
MQSIQNLTNELINGYTQSKYDKKYLKKKVNDILESIIPKVATIIKGKKEIEVVKLWNDIKENEEIKNSFKELFEKVERPIVIYVASKFGNNQYFGTWIIEGALKWK